MFDSLIGSLTTNLVRWTTSGYSLSQKFENKDGIVKGIQTIEGKKEYLEFFHEQPIRKYTALQRLYGTSFKGHPTTSEVKKYVHQLFILIHPDKMQANGGVNEIALHTELFQKIQQDLETYSYQPPLNEEYNRIRELAFSDDTDIPISHSEKALELIQNSRWDEAYQLTQKSHELVFRFDPKFTFLCSYILIAVGKYDQAADLVPAKYSEMKLAIENLVELLKQGPKINSENCEEVIRSYRNIESDMNDLAQKYSNSSLGIFSNLIPFSFYKVLKEAYRIQDNSWAEYDTCLREAIRRCPSSYKEEKKQLIAELSSHVHFCGNHPSEELNTQAILLQIAKSTFIKFLKTFRGKKREAIFRCLISVTPGDLAGTYPFEKEKTLLSDLIGMLEFDKNKHHIIERIKFSINHFTKIKEDKGFNREFSFSQEEINQLEVLIRFLKGLKFYLDDSSVDHLSSSLGYFSFNAEHLGIAIIEIEKGNLVSAINYFSKSLRNSNDNHLEKLILSCVFDVMNSSDCFYEFERQKNTSQTALGKLKEIELKAIHHFYSDSRPIDDQFLAQAQADFEVEHTQTTRQRNTSGRSSAISLETALGNLTSQAQRLDDLDDQFTDFMR